MRVEMWIVLAALSCLFATMLLAPRWLMFWRIHRTQAWMAVSRGLGALGLLFVLGMLVLRLLD